MVGVVLCEVAENLFKICPGLEPEGSRPTQNTYLPISIGGGGDTGGGATSPESEQEASARPTNAPRKAVNLAVFIFYLVVSLIWKIPESLRERFQKELT